jgi:hypothetical protein
MFIPATRRVRVTVRPHRDQAAAGLSASNLVIMATEPESQIMAGLTEPPRKHRDTPGVRVAVPGRACVPGRWGPESIAISEFSLEMYVVKKQAQGW